MRFASLISAAVSLSAVAVDAGWDDIYIPSVIKKGESFDALGLFLWSFQPRDRAIIWWYGSSAPVGWMGQYLGLHATNSKVELGR